MLLHAIIGKAISVLSGNLFVYYYRPNCLTYLLVCI